MKTPDDFVNAINERKNDPSKIAKSGRWDPTSRAVGAIVFAVGLMEAAYCYLTIDQALNHATEITYFRTLACLSPFLLLVGTTWMVLGKRGPQILGPTYSPTRVGWAFYACYLIVSLAFGYVFQHYLMSLGYEQTH